MYQLRTLSIGDVVRALEQRELRVAVRISGNLFGNAVNAARSHLPRRSQLPLNRAQRQAS